MNVIQLQVATIVLVLFLQIVTSFFFIRRVDQYKSEVEACTQQAIVDVAEQISGTLVASLNDPMTKRAMSILGKQSGVVRAEKATLDKFNEALPNMIPSLGIIGEQLGMEPLEMLQLLNDPLVGSILQGFLGGGGGGGASGNPKAFNFKAALAKYGG